MLWWALAFATSDRRKVLLSLLSVAILVLIPAHRVPSGAFVTVSVAMLLLWTTRMELSSAGAAKMLAWIANSSLYIYLVHPLMFMPLLKLFGEGVTFEGHRRNCADGALICYGRYYPSYRDRPSRRPMAARTQALA
ncbi:MAG: hypothetical protein ACSLE1_12785 [Sphingobium sp.]